MRTIKLIILLLLFSTIIYAQLQDTIFFDSKWKHAASRSEASYYRLTEKKGDKQFLVSDYFINNSIQMRSSASQLDTLIKEGHCIFFHAYKNGSIKYSEGNYYKNKMDGSWNYYDTLGRLFLIQNYLTGYKINPSEWHDTLGNIFIEEKWSSKFNYDVAQRDFVLHYPTEIKNHNKDTVFVIAIIDIDGSLTHVKIQRSKNSRLNKPALEFIKSLPKFSPATKNKVPIKKDIRLDVEFTSKKDLL